MVNYFTFSTSIDSEYVECVYGFKDKHRRHVCDILT
jgi:hypothetical protein